MSPIVKRKREERKAQIEIARQKEEERLRIEEPHNTIPAKGGLRNYFCLIELIFHENFHLRRDKLSLYTESLHTKALYTSHFIPK